MGGNISFLAVLPFLPVLPFLAVLSVPPFGPADPRRHALEVPAQLVDRGFPPRTLMLDDGLDDAERTRFERLPVVLERAVQCRGLGEPAFGEEAADLEFRVRPRFDSPEQLQHVGVIEEHDAVALIAAAAGPFALGSGIDSIDANAA